MSLARAAGIKVAEFENAVGRTEAEIAVALDETIRADPKACAALVAEAVRFLRCGTLTLTEWTAQMPCEKEALVEAAETVLAERAAAHGFASLSENHAKHVASRSDGGASLKDALLDRAVRELAGKAQTEPSVPS